jgi:hypothetical protein
MGVGGERHASDPLPPGGRVGPRAVWTIVGSKLVEYFIYTVLIFFFGAVACPVLSIFSPVSCHFWPSSVSVSLFLIFSII